MLLYSDTRTFILTLLGRLELSLGRRMLLALGALGVAAAVAWLPDWQGLSADGRSALFILLLAAGLWVSEAIPPFAVAVLVMGLEVQLLGRLGRGVDEEVWLVWLRPWSSPIIWLFLGGLVMGQAASRAQFDRLLAARMLSWSRGEPRRLLLGVMVLTFGLSMFLSNTATTAMMLAVLGPLFAGAGGGEGSFARRLLTLVPLSANLGGMGTLIGSPPNAVAAASLEVSDPIGFGRWMLFAVPPSLLLAGVLWAVLERRSGSLPSALDVNWERQVPEGTSRLPRWKRHAVAAVMLATLGLWLTEAVHHIPVYVVAFLPVVVFSVLGVVTERELRALPWDVLLLLAGGLSLGLAVSDSGLAAWLMARLPLEGLGKWALACLLAWLAAALSNFMSNTAATNILVPLAAAVGGGADAALVAPIAFSASAAMCLPISSPTNALAFSTGALATRDFLRPGLWMAALGPPLAVAWATLVL